MKKFVLCFVIAMNISAYAASEQLPRAEINDPIVNVLAPGEKGYNSEKERLEALSIQDLQKEVCSQNYISMKMHSSEGFLQGCIQMSLLFFERNKVEIIKHLLIARIYKVVCTIEGAKSTFMTLLIYMGRLSFEEMATLNDVENKIKAIVPNFEKFKSSDFLNLRSPENMLKKLGVWVSKSECDKIIELSNTLHPIIETHHKQLQLEEAQKDARLIYKAKKTLNELKEKGELPSNMESTRNRLEGLIKNYSNSDFDLQEVLASKSAEDIYKKIGSSVSPYNRADIENCLNELNTEIVILG